MSAVRAKVLRTRLSAKPKQRYRNKNKKAFPLSGMVQGSLQGNRGRSAASRRRPLTEALTSEG